MDLSALIFTGLGNDTHFLRKRKYEPQCQIQDFDQYYEVELLTNENTILNQELNKAIASIEMLEDNWDGYGAAKPSKNVIAQVRNLLAALPNQFVENLTSDNIYPNPNGTVTIEWTNENEEIASIEIGDKNSTFYSKFNNSSLYTNDHIGLLKGESLPFDLMDKLNHLNS